MVREINTYLSVKPTYSGFPGKLKIFTHAQSPVPMTPVAFQSPSAK